MKMRNPAEISGYGPAIIALHNPDLINAVQQLDARRSGLFDRTHRPHRGADSHYMPAVAGRDLLVPMGFALWIDPAAGLAWAQGTHEYRPMGTAVISRTDQFRPRDFQQRRRRPASLDSAFVGFFGSLEDLNARLRAAPDWKLHGTPGHLR